MKVCWKCSSHHHIGRNCPSDYCFNCDQSGHLAADCPEFIKCSLCKSENHLAVDCDGNWGRRTLAQRTPARLESPEHEGMAENADQNIMNEGAEESEVNESVEGADMSNERAEEADADLDNGSDDSEDEIHSFSTEDPVEVCESIDEFPSREPSLGGGFHHGRTQIIELRSITCPRSGFRQFFGYFYLSLYLRPSIPCNYLMASKNEAECGLRNWRIA